MLNKGILKDAVCSGRLCSKCLFNKKDIPCEEICNGLSTHDIILWAIKLYGYEETKKILRKYINNAMQRHMCNKYQCDECPARKCCDDIFLNINQFYMLDLPDEVLEMDIPTINGIR